MERFRPTPRLTRVVCKCLSSSRGARELEITGRPRVAREHGPTSSTSLEGRVDSFGRAKKLLPSPRSFFRKALGAEVPLRLRAWGPRLHARARVAHESPVPVGQMYLGFRTFLGLGPSRSRTGRVTRSEGPLLLGGLASLASCSTRRASRSRARASLLAALASLLLLVPCESAGELVRTRH